MPGGPPRDKRLDHFIGVDDEAKALREARKLSPDEQAEHESFMGFVKEREDLLDEVYASLRAGKE